VQEFLKSVKIWQSCCQSSGPQFFFGTQGRMMGLTGRERSLTVSSVVWIQYTNVAHRQMNRHWATAKSAYA